MTVAVYDMKEIRDNFPILGKVINGHPLVYFDSAATTQKPKRVIDAMSAFYLQEYGTVHRAIYELSMEATDKYDSTRECIKNLINAESDEEIVFTRGTTDSINLVRFSFGNKFIQKGDEIIISETEHHSNLVPWQMLCQERGAILRFIPVDDRGEIILDDYKKLLNKKTKLVSVAHIFNSTGTINPVKEITAMAHATGARVLIDGAQAAGHMAIDVQDIGADFYAFSGHKAYGPTGVGVLYGKMELLEKMPPVHGGGDMVERVTLEESLYQYPPLRFEAGTPMFAEVIALQEAFKFLQEIGLDNIKAHEDSLLAFATEELQKISGLRIYGTSNNKGAIISFNVEGVHPLDIGTFLDLKGIAVRTGHHCSHPTMKRFGVDATVRVSFGIYNTQEEIETFIFALKDIISHLRN